MKIGEIYCNLDLLCLSKYNVTGAKIKKRRSAHLLWVGCIDFTLCSVNEVAE